MSLKKIVLLCLLTTSLIAADRDTFGAIDVIKYLFETKYAPLYFKEQTLGWNLNRSINTLKGSIALTKNPQWLLRKFFLQPCDYHTCVLFHSTANASLPFTVKKIDNSIYVSWASAEQCDLEIGDEILLWDGFPAVDVFDQFKQLEVIDTIEMHSTNALTEHYFTERSGQYGYAVPRGKVHLSVLANETHEVKDVDLSWKTESEYYPFKGFTPVAKSPFQIEQKEPINPLLQKKSICATFSPRAKVNEQRSFEIASKRGFLPYLGPISNSFKKSPFFYYIYKTPNDKKVAFLRIGTFDFERDDLTHLKKALNYFEKNSDAMVLDITHNPGGQVLNLFAVLSYFLEDPIKNYEQNEILTTEEIELAVSLKVGLENLIEDEQETLKFIKKESQYHPSMTLAHQFLNYAEFLLACWENGERITPLYPILGIDQIHPDPSCHYSKPVMILIDNLSLSCGDFFPALMQEAGRASLFGQRTGGAGGTVTQPIEFPNSLGIKLIQLTTSIVYKSNGDWIENKGIEPDYIYEITPEDLKYDFINYVEVLNETLDECIENAPVRSRT